MYCERDIRTGNTCIHRRLNGTGEHIPGTILYIGILLKIDDDDDVERLHGIENSRASASETRGYKLCALRHILP